MKTWLVDILFEGRSDPSLYFVRMDEAQLPGFSDDLRKLKKRGKIQDFNIVSIDRLATSVEKFKNEVGLF